jgi:hypothetical protein
MARPAIETEYKTTYFTSINGDVTCDRTIKKYRGPVISGLPVTKAGISNTPYSVYGSFNEDFAAGYNRYTIVDHKYVLLPFTIVKGVSSAEILSQVSIRTDVDAPLFPDAIEARNRGLLNASRRAEAQALVTIAETQKTVNMVVGLIPRLFNWFMDIYRSLKRFQIKKLFDITSDIWLEIRYGWRPLYGDIQNIQKALQPARIKGIHATYGSDAATFEDECRSYHQAFNLKVFNLNHKVTKKAIAKSGFTYILHEDNNVLDRLGLHFESLLSTAWELIPFSFIIDWFVDLGGLLAYESSVKVKPYNSYDTIYTETVVETTMNPTLNYTALTPETILNRSNGFSRSIPNSQHGYEHQFNAQLSWDQSADLIAIGSKIISGIFRK